MEGGLELNTKGAKLLLFGLVITLFSLMLVFAGFMLLLLDFAPHVLGTLVNSWDSSFTDTFYYIGTIVGLAIVVGIGGLFVAWFGLNRND